MSNQSSKMMHPDWVFQTEDDVKGLFTLKDHFEQQAKEVAKEYVKITGDYYNDKEARVDWEGFDPENPERIPLGGTEYYRGAPNNFCIDLPTRYLWEDGWQEQLRIELVEKKRAKEAAEHDKKRRDMSDREQFERNLYERLKARYEPEE